MIDIQQEIQLLIPAHNILDAHLSVPKWSQEKINNTYGLLRDYPRAKELYDRMRRETVGCGFDDIMISLDEDSKRLYEPVYAYDPSGRRSYPRHVLDCISPKKANSIIAIGNGNLINNLGIIGCVTEEGKYKLLKSSWEEKRIIQRWQYSCLYYDRNNKQVSIEHFTFHNGYPQPMCNFSWLTSGQPILWDGRVSETEDLIAETYDIRHIYMLHATSGSEGDQKIARCKIQEYMKIWMDVFVNGPQHSASERLRAVARAPEFGFDRLQDHHDGRCLSKDREECSFIEKRYLQSAIGVDYEGNIYIVQKNGSLKEIGLTLKDMGAKRGILLDQGGSVGTFYIPQVKCMSSDLSGGFILRSRDFRTKRLCILIWELNTDIWSEA